jgi:hypothetical protein
MSLIKSDNPCVKRLALCIGKSAKTIAANKCQYIHVSGGVIITINGHVMYATKTVKIPEGTKDGPYEAEPFFESGEFIPASPDMALTWRGLVPHALPSTKINLTPGKYVEYLKPAKRGHNCIGSLYEYKNNSFVVLGQIEIPEVKLLFQLDLGYLKPFSDTLVTLHCNPNSFTAGVITPPDKSYTTTFAHDWFMLIMPCKSTSHLTE